MTTETPASATPAPAQAATPAPSATSELPGGAAPTGDGAVVSDPQQPSDPAGPDSEEAIRTKARERFDKRFGEMSRKTREAEIRAARAEGELEAMRRIGTPVHREPAAEPAPQAAPSAPNPKDYAGGEYDPRYAADLAKFEIREEQRQEREAEATRQRQREQNASFEEGRARYEDTLNRARSLAVGEEAAYFQNAEKVLDLGRVPVSRGGLPAYVIDAITQSDNAVHVAEVLGRNPDQAPAELRALIKSPGELAKMRPNEVERVIARLDDRIGLILEAAKRSPAPSAQTQASQTSPPSPPVQPAPQAPNRGAAPLGDPPRGDMRAFKSWREKAFGGAAKR